MITGVVTLFAIVICVFLTIFDILKLPMLFLLMVLVLLFIVQIVHQYHTLGKERFWAPFKKEHLPAKRVFLLQTLSNLPAYHKIVMTDSADSDYLLLSETGIYLMKMCDTKGIITEHQNKEYWRVEMDNYHSVVRNDLYFLKRQATQIEKALKITIHPYLIITDFTILQIPFDKKITITKEKNFIFKFQNQKARKVYSKERIEELYFDAVSYFSVK